MSLRAAALRLHRWTGLVLAGFLVVVAVTGIPLAWYDTLDAASAPALHRSAAPAPGAVPLDALVLRERVARHSPGAAMSATPLSAQPGRTVAFPIWLREDGDAVLHEVFIDPYTGAVRGQRRWGDPAEGLRNLMPFLHRLHTALWLEGVGELLLGVVALLWTLDGFVGAWLTLPPRPARRASAAPLAARWGPAWCVRWRGGAHKRNFDLHRAGGLWLWGALTLMAWSSVALNLPAVYDPLMRAGLAYQDDPRRGAAREQGAPMTPEAARDTGRRLMADLAAREGFAVEREHWLALDPRRNLYRYSVRSSRDLRERSGATSVVFGAVAGRIVGSHLPTGRAAGDTVKHWLTSLHMAAMWGLPLRLAVALVGAVTLVLSVTGVWLWWARRGARRAGRRGRA
ncbi:PepSY-associated TM helix domain-containing protein [Bordetella genomosp. 1]|uniref:PepSY-associated TM helix domain-containing protein n=1 Tax=Bordetella genomosp. 1 TaxID=1395607 RepID=UPI001595984B|nr:PepSY-associated TM helix domain-containing protein [Bordetella genomosp. 1]